MEAADGAAAAMMTPHEVAIRGCQLMRAAYEWRLDMLPGVELRARVPANAHGVQARLIRDRSLGGLVLVVPGTGHYERGEPDETWSDWLANLRAAFAVPRLGESGRFWWAWGFLDIADFIEEWLGDLPERGDRIVAAFGHSQGAAALQPLVWSRPDWFVEAHALASPKVCYSTKVPLCDRLHVWTAPDDLVCYLPPFAGHIGTHVHALPRNGRRHGPSSYAERIILDRATVPTDPAAVFDMIQRRSGVRGERVP